MEKKNDIDFCPSCGNKLNGDENVCPFCGYRILENKKSNNTQQIPEDKPSHQTAAVNNVSASIEKKEKIQPKKKSRGLLIFLIIAVVLILGIGTVAFLQYKSIIGIRFLNNIIPSETKKNMPVKINRNYYFCYATFVGNNSKVIAISDIFEKKDNYNTELSAKTDFEKSFKKSYPKEYFKFSKTKCINGSDYGEVSKQSEFIKNQFNKYRKIFIKIK